MSDAQIRLLGGVEAHCDGAPVPLGARRMRTLLALLALDAGRTVSIERLARGIWDDQPPQRVRGSLQTYVSRLRRVLGEDAVTTEPTGYALRVPRKNVDALRFRDAVTRASQCSTHDEEQSCLDEALAVWEGQPFEGELSSWLERFERPRLTEEYLQVLERRLGLDLERGEYSACALRLGSLVQEHPLRETLWVLLLRALEGAGRTAEALERYETVRSLLATELGTDPGPELQQMYYRLLAAADSGPIAAREELPGPSVPRQLPAATAIFTGRSHELARLGEMGEKTRGVIAVLGPGGAGKTSLVLHWAHQVVGDFPDGQMFVDLRGFGPGQALTPTVVAGLLLRGVGVASKDVPDDSEARVGLLRSLLADRRCLIVLDNARDAAQVRPLLVGGQSLVVVTSRRQLRSLIAREGAARLPLGQMSPSEAVGLLRARISAGDLPGQVPEDVLAALAALCGHLPVALSIVAERAARDPDGLTETLAELGESASRLDVLATGEDESTDVRAVLDWTVRELDEDAAHMFAMLGLYPDSPVCSMAASALSGLTWRECRARLDQLAAYHLLDPLPGAWYAVHDLVSAFAREVAEHELPAVKRDEAITRLRSWFVHTAENARYALQQHGSSLRLRPCAPGVEPRTFADSTQAQQWFARHRVAIATLLADAERDHDYHTACGALVNALVVSLEYAGARLEARRLAEHALELAERSGDEQLLGPMINLAGTRAALDGEFDEGRALFEQARPHFAAVGNWLWWVRVTQNIAVCLGGVGRHQEAVVLLEEAHRKGEEVGFSAGEQGYSLSLLASERVMADDAERAITETRQAVVGLTEAGEGYRLALCHETLASALAKLHRWSEAEQAVADAATEFERCGNTDMLLKLPVEFARLQRSEGELEAAAATLKRGLAEIQRHEASGDYDGTTIRALIHERMEDLRTGSTATWGRM